MIRIEFLLQYLYHTKRIAARCAACIGGTGKTRFGHFVGWGRHKGVERVPRKCRMKTFRPKTNRDRPIATHCCTYSIDFCRGGRFLLIYIYSRVVYLYCILYIRILCPFAYRVFLCVIYNLPYFFLLFFYQYLKNTFKFK